MKWKALVVIAMLAGWCPAEQKKAAAPYEEYRQAAVEMNGIAGKIQSPDDARRLVGMIADEFKDELPPGKAQRRICERIAAAEYETATDASRRIPEERIAAAWNRYAAEIGAPADATMTVAEIHYLRDALYTSSRIFWRGGNQSIWTLPAIYATGPDGRLDERSRALEALMVVWDLAANLEDFSGLRESARKGVLLSDEFRKEAEEHHSPHSQVRVLVGQMRSDPIRAAESRYAQQHGAKALRRNVEAMIDELIAQ